MTDSNSMRPSAHAAGGRPARRRASFGTSFGCETLEGRQLLAAGLGAGLPMTDSLLPFEIGAMPGGPGASASPAGGQGASVARVGPGAGGALLGDFGGPGGGLAGRGGPGLQGEDALLGGPQ